jgi:hypothetical protein
MTSARAPSARRPSPHAGERGFLFIDYQAAQLAAVPSMDHALLMKNAVPTVRTSKIFGVPIVHSTVNVRGLGVGQMRGRIAGHGVEIRSERNHDAANSDGSGRDACSAGEYRGRSGGGRGHTSGHPGNGGTGRA